MGSTIFAKNEQFWENCCTLGTWTVEYSYIDIDYELVVGIRCKLVPQLSRVTYDFDGLASQFWDLQIIMMNPFLQIAKSFS